MALVNESTGQGRANKTCDSCDEITGHLSFLRLVYRDDAKYACGFFNLFVGSKRSECRRENIRG
jgi:hypothetical protein